MCAYGICQAQRGIDQTHVGFKIKDYFVIRTTSFFIVVVVVVVVVKNGLDDRSTAGLPPGGADLKNKDRINHFLTFFP